MNARWRENAQGLSAEINGLGHGEDRVFDPLTGELIEIADRERILDLHDRLEGVALEILSACRDIRRALMEHVPGVPRAQEPRLSLWGEPEDATIPLECWRS